MEKEKVINALKSALAQASALGHPNDKFFHFSSLRMKIEEMPWVY